MRNIVAAIALSLLAPAPASAQQPSNVDVNAFVAPGKTLIVMREALEQLLRIEPSAKPGKVLLDYLETKDWASVSAVYFLPFETVGDAVILKSRNFRSYSAEVRNGHAGALALETLDDEDKPSDDGKVYYAFNSIETYGDDLMNIGRAFDALRSKYGSQLNLADMLVSYTSIEVGKNTGSETASSKIAGYVVFTSPAHSYTALLEDGELHEAYEGIVEPGEWLAPRYR